MNVVNGIRMVVCSFSAKWHSGSTDWRVIAWSWSSTEKKFTGVEFIPERLSEEGKEIFCGTECED